jgi:hypothetical protein
LTPPSSTIPLESSIFTTFIGIAKHITVQSYQIFCFGAFLSATSMVRGYMKRNPPFLAFVKKQGGQIDRERVDIV